MPTSGGGFEQCYNAQASVDIDTMLIVGQHLTQNPNDKQEIKPALKALNELPEELGAIDSLLADNGYFSQDNVNHCLKEELLPYISGVVMNTTKVSKNVFPNRRLYPKMPMPLPR
jgi:hypothetical protein